MTDQHIRNAISFVGAFVFVFGGLYLVDYYSGWRPFADWRPFESRVASTEVKGPVTYQASNDFSGSRETATTTLLRLDENLSIPEPNQLFQCDVDGKAVFSTEPCDESKAQGRHR